MGRVPPYHPVVAVALKRGLWSYVRKNSDSFWLQLATDDDERAAVALERAADAIRSVPHPNEPDEPAVSYISDVERVPGGPCMACDFKDLPDRVLRAALDAAVASLEADGIEGTLQPPRERKDAPFWTVLADGHHTPPYPPGWALLVVRETRPFDRGMAEAWVEPLSAWAVEGRDDELFWASVVDIAFQLPTSSLSGFIARQSSISRVATGEHGDRLRHIYMGGSHVIVSERGPSVRGDELASSAERLRELGRTLAPAADYVALDFPAARTRFGEHDFPVHYRSFINEPRMVVPGAYPWQVLSRTHVDALARLPQHSAWIDDRHLEVSFGEAEAWTAPATRVNVERDAEQVLGALVGRPPRSTAVRVEGGWGSIDDVRNRLARVASIRIGDRAYGPRRRGEAWRDGAFVKLSVFQDPPQAVAIHPSHAVASAALVDDLVEALVAGGSGDTEVRRQVIGMITVDDVIPLLLDACPSFRAEWPRIEQENRDEEGGGRLHYIDAGDFVRHLVQLRLAGRTEEFPAVFAVLSRLVAEGDDYVSELGVIGYLEGMQMETVTSAGLDPETDFRPFCTPLLAVWWDRLNRFWEGDPTALRAADTDPPR